MSAFLDEVLHVMNEHCVAVLPLCFIFSFSGLAVEKFCRLFFDKKE